MAESASLEVFKRYVDVALRYMINGGHGNARLMAGVVDPRSLLLPK